MSAQYRPYRDEDGPENEQINWADHEPNSVQIYEKTTEDIQVVSSRRLILSGIGISIVACLVGFLLGYFGHTGHSECIPQYSVALHSVRDENTTIRQRILDLISVDKIKENVRQYSEGPHSASSEADYELAQHIYNLWIEHGLDRVEIPSYDVLLSHPSNTSQNRVEIIDDKGNVVFSSLHRDKNEHRIPAFSAYSPSGNVTGDLVYVNYGLMPDLSYIQNNLNISLQGKILIARQGLLSPHEQVIHAIAVNASALILYPDPAEFNPPEENQHPYPESFWMPDDAVRMGSVYWNGIGDPLTPGYPATVYAFRHSPNSVALPTIPVQPVSYKTAYHLLSQLGGAEAPSPWKGGFNFSYHIGPGFRDSEKTNHKVAVKVSNRLETRTIRNVIGYLKGKVEPDRYVLIGSHRDSWTSGALDAAGGTAALLELSRVFGYLLKDGWRPRRTIIFCSWGADEYNLIGSTEWLEENLKVLHGRAVAYISADVFVVGNYSLSVASSPLLYHAIFNATKEVPNPNKNELDFGLKTVYDSWLRKFPVTHNTSSLLCSEQAEEESFDWDDEELTLFPLQPGVGVLKGYLHSAMLKVQPRIRSMDSSSHYAPFFLRAGIPSVDVAYANDPAQKIGFPLQHTEYDDFELVEKIVDPGFRYHAAVTQVLGELLRDLSDSLFLPFNLFNYARVLKEIYSNLHMKAEDEMKSHKIDLGHLQLAIDNFSIAACRFHAVQELLDLSDPMAIRRINDQLLLLERAFLDSNGLPRNDMKKHIILSPSEMEPHMDDMFPGLLDEFANMVHTVNNTPLWDVIRAHFATLVFTIQSAARTISDVA